MYVSDSLPPCLQYRGTILRMFKTVKSVRRKQVLEALTKECGEEPDSKTLSSALKVYQAQEHTHAFIV